MPNIQRQQEPTDEAIATRAYKIWEERGCPDGDGADNWKLAKQQLISEAEVPSANSSPIKRLIAHIRKKVA